jgi:hypothetical protein
MSSAHEPTTKTKNEPDIAHHAANGSEPGAPSANEACESTPPDLEKQSQRHAILKSTIRDEARIPPCAFLRAMVSIAWSSIRHPLSTTLIDLSTGYVIRES